MSNAHFRKSKNAEREREKCKDEELVGLESKLQICSVLVLLVLLLVQHGKGAYVNANCESRTEKENTAADFFHHHINLIILSDSSVV